MADAKAPTWMKRILQVAGVYNLVWGSAAIFFPEAMLRFLAVETNPAGVGFWQCIGMIVGVYGIGYLLAANDPFRHWPIVLVGLLGKLFGPIGFLGAVTTGKLPASMGWTLLTNDLVWWAPFSAILWSAARADPSADRPNPDFDPWQTPTSTGDNLLQLSNDGPKLLLFLRHAGCTFCREALDDLRKVKPDLDRKGIGVILVHLGDDDAMAAMMTKYGFGSTPRVADPTRSLYRAFDLQRGTLGQILSPKIWWRGFLAVLRGHGLGKIEGDVFQLPGAFLIHNGHILRAFRHQTAADRPDYLALACPT